MPDYFWFRYCTLIAKKRSQKLSIEHLFCMQEVPGIKSYEKDSRKHLPVRQHWASWANRLRHRSDMWQLLTYLLRKRGYGIGTRANNTFLHLSVILYVKILGIRSQRNCHDPLVITELIYKIKDLILFQNLILIYFFSAGHLTVEICLGRTPM